MFEIERYQKAFDEVHASERTKQEVLRMSSGNTPTRRRGTGRRVAILAAAVALMAVLGMAAYAAIKMDGFALTGDMPKVSIDNMLEEYSPVTHRALVEPDGTVHYLDEQGNEIMVLTAEEAAKYEQEQREAKENAVRSSTGLIDVDTLPGVPNSVTELVIGADGSIPDFALGNGHMAILCGADKKGWDLKAGDSLALTLTSNDDCFLVFYVIRDGVMLSNEYDPTRVQSHTFSFEAAEPGSYCLGLMYGSASASNFTNGTLLVEQSP